MVMAAITAGKDEYFLPAFEDESIEVECLLVEPKNDHVSVDGIFDIDMKSSRKFMALEDLPCEFGGLESNTTQEGEDDIKLEVLNVMPCEVDDMGNLQAGNDISSTCGDYLLDIEFAESVPKLDCNSSEGLHSGNSNSEHKIPGFSRSDNGTLGMPKPSAAITPMPECQNSSLEKTICELHGVCSSKCMCKTPVKGMLRMQVPTSFDFQNGDKLEDVTNFLGGGISSNTKKKNMIFTPGLSSKSIFCTTTVLQNDIASPGDERVEQESAPGMDVSTKTPAEASEVDSLLTEKRLRKPTRRYIEESSDLNSRSGRIRQEASTSTSKGKFTRVRFHRHHHIGSREMMLSSEETFHDAGSQVQFGSQVHGDCLKKHAYTAGSNSDDESSPTESEDNHITTVRSENCGGQRKHHRPWNISEVRKLIDGVSQYGVGRWTAIKRLLFSSSVHRTPVDLKDKWRNLLRASYSQKQSKREDEENRKHAWHHLPKSVLRRVSELAIIHPYPRYRKSKLSCVSSPTHPLNRRIIGTRN